MSKTAHICAIDLLILPRAVEEDLSVSVKSLQNILASFASSNSKASFYAAKSQRPTHNLLSMCFTNVVFFNSAFASEAIESTTTVSLSSLSVSMSKLLEN